MKRFISVLNKELKEMIESQLPDIKYYPISSGKLRRYLSFENAKDVLKY